MANKVAKNSQKTRIEDTKLKPLSPTLRQKKRFVKCKIICKNKIDFTTVSESLMEELITYLGVFELGKAGFWVLRDKFDFDSQEFIFKVSTKHVDRVIGALSLILFLGNNNPCRIEVVRVSGTLKGLEKEEE